MAADRIRWSELSYTRRSQIKAAVFAAKGEQCQIRLTGCTGQATTVDHVVPDQAGGPHSVENLEPACQPCNHKRGASGMAYTTTTTRADVGPSRDW